MAIPTLTDGVVTLRAHRPADVPAIVEQSTDPLSRRWTSVPVPYTDQDARRFVHDVMPGGWATHQEWGFAIEAPSPDGPRYAGTVSLRNEGPGRAEIAYGSHPWARGTGTVERALRLLLDWGFGPLAEGGLGLGTVIWWAERGNWASRRTAWRIGFSCDGTVRRWLPGRDLLGDAWVGTLAHDAPRAPATPWLDTPTVVGELVTLRAHRESDVDRIVEACSDPATSFWLGTVPTPYTAEHARTYLENRTEILANGAGIGWAVADPRTDVLLGTVSLLDLGSASGAEVGYWTHPGARGRGVTTEAVRLAVRHAFIDVADGGLGLTRLRLVSAVENVASRRVAVANGFREVGVERAGTRCRDGAHDSVLHDLLPSDLG